MGRVHTILSMITMLALLPCSVAASFPGAAAADEHALASDKQPLRVLYAGKPGSARMADYQRFLNEHFAGVGTMSLGEFTASAADNYDVVILDWDSIYARDASGKIIGGQGLQMPRVPTLEAGYARPTILIGAVAGIAGQNPQHGLKFDWL